MFTKNDLKTGMFGVMDNGDKFVVVNDTLVYQNDGWDNVASLDENLSMFFSKVMTVYTNCRSFRHLNGTIKGTAHHPATLVYDRERDNEPLYNGKVVCIDTVLEGNAKLYTVGKIYTFVDGQLMTDTKCKIPTRPIHSFDEWSKRSDSKWIEIKE